MTWWAKIKAWLLDDEMDWQHRRYIMQSADLCDLERRLRDIEFNRAHFFLGRFD